MSNGGHGPYPCPDNLLGCSREPFTVLQKQCENHPPPPMHPARPGVSGEHSRSSPRPRRPPSVPGSGRFIRRQPSRACWFVGNRSWGLGRNPQTGLSAILLIQESARLSRRLGVIQHAGNLDRAGPREGGRFPANANACSPGRSDGDPMGRWDACEFCKTLLAA